MKEIKKTITHEEVIGYEAFDGSRFGSKDACEEYESSAYAAAKRSAWNYLVGERSSYDVLGCDEVSLAVFEVPDVNAYKIICHWAELEGVWDRGYFTPDYIGKRVAFFCDGSDDFSFLVSYATEEQMLQFYTEQIKALFADKPKSE